MKYTRKTITFINSTAEESITTTAATTAPLGKKNSMYPTREEINKILEHPLFTSEFTESSKKYVFYRGKLNVTVYTLRFNFLPSFDEDFMLRTVTTKLMSSYPMQTRLLGLFQYDLLLRNSEADPNTFYIWRANSNQKKFDEAHEISFSLNYANIHRFVQAVVQTSIPDLNINFHSSKVVIERPLSVVFSFLPV